jgi:hypothetical protein
VARNGLLIAVILLLALAGCGTIHAGEPGAAPSPALSLWRGWGFSGDQIVSVSVEHSARVLVIAAKVPAGQADCATDLTATLIGWVPTTADITLTFRSPWQGDLSKCPSLQVKTTDLNLPGQLGKRDIVIDTAATFAPTNTTIMRRCSDFGGACTFPPVPPATCSDASYGYAMLSTGPPQDAAYSDRGCDGHWLVLDIGWPGGAAGCDGPSCGQDMAVTHWFFSAGPHGWVTIANSRTAGCTRVHQVEPAFPAKLCATLPAIP